MLPDNEPHTCCMRLIAGSAISQPSFLLQCVSDIKPGREKPVIHFQLCKDGSGACTLRIKATLKSFVFCFILLLLHRLKNVLE